MELNILPVVLSGGSGTRLWPLSRAEYPKQLLSLSGNKTMLQETIARFDNVCHTSPPIIVCNESHRFLVAEQLREINCVPSSILLEPVGRNTAPALTLAALTVSKQANDAILVVMPADHIIENLSAFEQALKKAISLAASDRLVTFGIKPTRAETGYGYIKIGQENTVEAFIEKPDILTATNFVKDPDYLWNSGMFVFKASAWMQAIKKYEPEIAEFCDIAVQNSRSDLDFMRIEEKSFTKCKNISIDYAVMEKTSLASVVPLDAGWSDIGSWTSLSEIMQLDSAGNYIEGDCYIHSTQNSFLLSHGRMIAAVGLKDTIVVETADAVLVANKNNSQDVKEIVNALKKEDREQLQSHTKVYRPWGFYQTVDSGKRFQVKRINVKPGASLSLQKHMKRAEHWVVVKGQAEIVRGEEKITLLENESTYIPIGMMHRLENKTKNELEIIEVQSGEYLGEDDIERFEDLYHRQ